MADKTALIKEAQKYLAKGQIDKAIGEWEKIVKDFPDGNNFNVIGDLYFKKGDKKNSIDAFHKAASIFRAEGFSLKALALFKKVLNVNPADAPALYALGELSEEKALITDAIKYYLAAADSVAKEGKKDKMLDVYEKILSLSPENIPLRIKVAEIFYKEGLNSGAAKEYLRIADIYEDKGDTQKAEEYYRKTIDVQPLNKDAVVGLSILHEKIGEIDKAISLMKEASVLFHQDVSVLMRTAELCLTGNHSSDAITYLSGINELEPKNVNARRLLGDIYFKEDQKKKAWDEYLIVLDDMLLQEKYDDAIKVLERFRDIDPAETGRRLVSLYRQLGEGPRIVEELTRLGDVFYDRDSKDEALGCYDEAAGLAPDNEYLRKRLAELRGEDKQEFPGFIEATDTDEIVELIEPEVSGQIPIKEQKTVEEILTEADIFAKYGLLGEAQKLLEGLKVRIPESVDLHLRLKALYTDIDDKESAVTECLILSELYRRSEDAKNSERALREAQEIFPADPRLAHRGLPELSEANSLSPSRLEKFAEAAAGEETALDNYDEELAEADFYARQGLVQEALKILLNLQQTFPENRDVAERLEALGGGSEVQYSSEIQETLEKPDAFYQLSEMQQSPAETSVQGETAAQGGPPEEAPQLEKGPAATEEAPREMEYEDFSFTESEIADAQEMPEPTLDNDVLDIFQEFKKGLESQLEDEDSETHYNLGIAYKEMGLVDDAIKEFQTAKNDKKRFLQSSSMLGICYMEKGLYSLAIDVLLKTLESITEHNDSYWSVKYDLAEAYEKSNHLKEALALYTEVYGWSAKFRNVSEKVGLLKTQTAGIAGKEQTEEKATKSNGKEKTKEKRDRVSYL